MKDSTQIKKLNLKWLLKAAIMLINFIPFITRKRESDGIKWDNYFVAHFLSLNRVKFTIKDTQLAVHFCVLDVAVLDGRIIVGDKQFLEKLNGQRTFAHATVADDNQFVNWRSHVRWFWHSPCHFGDDFTQKSTPSRAWKHKECVTIRLKTSKIIIHKRLFSTVATPSAQEFRKIHTI